MHGYLTRTLVTLALVTAVAAAVGCVAVDATIAAASRRFTVALWGDMRYVKPGAPDTETAKIGPLIISSIWASLIGVVPRRSISVRPAAG